MAYTALKTRFDPYTVRMILSFHQSYQPDCSELYKDQLSTIHYYVVYIVPKARSKFGPDWKQYVSYNPFVQSYLVSRKFYD